MMRRCHKLITGIVILLVVCVFISCGGEENEVTSFGIENGIYLDEMSNTEKQSFCQWYVDLWGGEGKQYTCEFSEDESVDEEEGDSTIDIPSVSDCLEMQQLGSHCMVDDVEECFLASDGDPCKVQTIDKCENFRNCVAGTGVENPPDNTCADTRIDCYCEKTDYENGGKPLGSIYLPSCWSWFICKPSNCSEYVSYSGKCTESGLCGKCTLEYCSGGVGYINFF